MIYIGYIVDRDTTDVEIYTSETFEDLEAQIEERYAELRKELELEEPHEIEDGILKDWYDPLGEFYDWSYVTRQEYVKKETE
jgi:hypothetical protein